MRRSLTSVGTFLTPNLVALSLFACGASAPPPATAVEAAPAAELRERGPNALCAARGPLPDLTCTPGAVMNIDLDAICNTSTSGRRHVAPGDHKKAFTEYGYSYPQARGAFEVDHLIPLELGGDNVLENLWAEPAEPRPGVHEKDKVENYLHRQVCAHAMTLADAQHQIVTDWLAVWRQISSTDGPDVDADGDGP